jgi:uncharacterized protein (TIGR02145 family)
MKKNITLLAILLLTATTYAQVGIGTTTPAGALDIVSTTSGLVLPRVANTSVVVNPNGGAIENGTMVYDLSANCVIVFVNGAWSGCIQFAAVAPDAPVIGTATAGNARATVAYTAPANGGSVITGYTATSSPGAFTGSLSQAGSGVITVTGLTNGTAYTFIVTATNAIGTGAASATSNSVTPIAPPISLTSQVSNGSGGFYTFLSHNLGADTSLDPHTPVKGLNGDYYQWGKNAPDADVDALIGSTWGDQGGTTANGNWTPGAKGPQDPCPAGYRVPSHSEWDDVHSDSNNKATRTGTFVSSNTNYGSALHYGTIEVPKQLTLPASGYRYFSNGTLLARGSGGFYWSSVVTGSSNAYFLSFYSSNVSPISGETRAYGFSLRCIAE